VRSEGFYVTEKSTDTSWDRTSDLPICSIALLSKVKYTISNAIVIVTYETSYNISLAITFGRFSQQQN